MRRVLHSRAAGYALALGIVAAGVLGAWLRSPLVMLAAPVAVVACVLFVAYRVADARAEHEFFTSFARARGLRYVGGYLPDMLTPLLGAGDRRECRHWMVGPVAADMPGTTCGLGHYTWFERKRIDDDTMHWVPHECTICMVDLEEGIRLFPGVFLARRRGLGGMLGNGWLNTSRRRKVELESVLLHDRYDLWVERSQDDILLRELFSPAFVARLAEHPLRPCFEYRAGALVVYLERRLEDAGRLGWLQDATAMIARRFIDEVAETRSGRAA